MIYVSVDVGRSSVKAIASKGSKQETLHFPSVFTDTWSIYSDEDNDFITTSFQTKHCFSLDDKYVGVLLPLKNYLFGDTALELGNNPTTYKESDSFHEFGVYASVYAASYFSHFFKDEEVSLAINLTFTNTHVQKIYAESLKKEFHVRLSDKTPIKFTIKELYCFQQGYSAIFNFLNTDRFDEILASTILIVDIGKHTTDFSLVKGFTLINGSSINVGTSQVIQRVKNLCASVTDLTDQQVEIALMDKRSFYQNVKGVKVTPYQVSTEHFVVEKVYKDIQSRLYDFIDRQNVHFLYLVGGGSKLFSDYFQADFKLDKLPSDGIFSNAKGMLKFISLEGNNG